MSTTQNLTPGTKVQIVPSTESGFLTCKWWPTMVERDCRVGSMWVRKASVVTGTVQKSYKNGNVAVAVDQLRNGSDDGLKTLNFKQSEVEAL